MLNYSDEAVVYGFLNGSGSDRIFDFIPGRDKLDLRGCEGVHSMADLTQDGISLHLQNGDKISAMYDHYNITFSANDILFA